MSSIAKMFSLGASSEVEKLRQELALYAPRYGAEADPQKKAGELPSEPIRAVTVFLSATPKRIDIPGFGLWLKDHLERGNAGGTQAPEAGTGGAQYASTRIQVAFAGAITNALGDGSGAGLQLGPGDGINMPRGFDHFYARLIDDFDTAQPTVERAVYLEVATCPFAERFRLPARAAVPGVQQVGTLIGPDTTAPIVSMAVGISGVWRLKAIVGCKGEASPKSIRLRTTVSGVEFRSFGMQQVGGGFAAQWDIPPIDEPGEVLEVIMGEAASPAAKYEAWVYARMEES